MHGGGGGGRAIWRFWKSDATLSQETSVLQIFARGIDGCKCRSRAGVHRGDIQPLYQSTAAIRVEIFNRHASVVSPS
jgi:hypothetical protein